MSELRNSIWADNPESRHAGSVRRLTTRRIFTSDQGNILLLTALCLTLVFGALALAIDVGQLYSTKRQLQTLADAAAMAGAMEIASCGGTANCTVLRNAASSALTENGASGFTTVSQCGTTSATGMVLTVNNGPCKLGGSDPNYNNKGYVEAVVKKPVTTFFAGILGIPSVTVSARSEAGGGSANYCVVVLDSSAYGALTMNGGSNLQASCGVIVDSNSSTAAIFNGGVIVKTSVLNIHGGVLNNGNNSLTPSPTAGTAVYSDPLSNLTKPTVGACGTSTAPPFYGSQSLITENSGQNWTFNPGVYCGGIQINGNATATFNPGLYIMNGAVIFNSGDTLTGSGITFYFASGSLTMNGGAHANFTAPSTGTYAGILYYQDPNDANTVILNGDSTSVWQGIFYAPKAPLTLNGGSNLAAYTGIVVDTLMDNSPNFTLGSDYSSLPGGNPLGGSSKTYLME